MATKKSETPLRRKDLLVLPELMTVLESKDDLKPKWKASEAILVGAGFGIPYLIYDAAGGNETPSAMQLGAVERATLLPLIQSGKIRFPFGMAPQVKLAYAQHPADPGYYIPFADFHHAILEDKIVEVTRLLIALGAVEIKAHWQKSKKREGVMSGKVVTDDDLMTMGVDGGFGSNDSHRYSIVLSGGSGERGPIPDLKWMGVDPVFQLAVDAADSSFQIFRRTISTSDMHSVDVSLAGRLPKVGLSLGGDYKMWENVSLALEARFTQTPDRARAEASPAAKQVTKPQG